MRQVFDTLSDTNSDSKDGPEDQPELMDCQKHLAMMQGGLDLNQAPVSQNGYVQRLLPSSLTAPTAGGEADAGDQSPSLSSLYDDLASVIPSDDSFSISSSVSGDACSTCNSEEDYDSNTCSSDDDLDSAFDVDEPNPRKRDFDELDSDKIGRAHV